LKYVFNNPVFLFVRFRELLNNGLRYLESDPWDLPAAAVAVTKKNVVGMNPQRPAGEPMKRLQRRDISSTWLQQRAQTRQQLHSSIGRSNSNNHNSPPTEATTTTNPDSNSRHHLLCIPRLLLQFITLRVTGVPCLVLKRVIPVHLHPF